MTNEKLKNDLVEIISSISLIKKPFEINFDDDLFSAGHLDSFIILSLIQKIEDQFGVVINYKDVQQENFKSINSISQLLKNKYQCN